MSRPRRKLIIALAALAVCGLAAIWATVKFTRGVSPAAQVTAPNTPGGPEEGRAEASIGPVEDQASKQPEEEVLESLLTDGDAVGLFEEQRQTELEKAKKELGEKLTSPEMRRRLDARRRGEPPPAPGVAENVVSQAEKARLLEEFLAKFPLSADTYWQGTMLAEVYVGMERFDDARRLYNDMIASVDDGAFSWKQQTWFALAGMETRAGNFQAAEEILRGIIDRPLPSQYREHMPAGDLDDPDMKRYLDAPLQLAELFRKTGRRQEAEALLNQVTDFALGIPRKYGAFDNMASYTGQAYQARIGLLFDQTAADQVDDALKSADALIEGYRSNLDGRDWHSPEHIRKYIDDYVNNMRKAAAKRAERIRQSASPGQP